MRPERRVAELGSLDLMATPTEKRALRLMMALKSEFDKCGRLVDCRPLIAVAPWISTWRHRDKVLAFVQSHRLVQIAGRDEAVRMLPSEPDGLAWISEQSKHAKEEFDRRFRVYAVIVAIIALAATVVGMLLKR